MPIDTSTTATVVNCVLRFPDFKPYLPPPNLVLNNADKVLVEYIR